MGVIKPVATKFIKRFKKLQQFELGTCLSSVPDGRGLENREVSCTAGLSMSVAGEVGMGIRSPFDES